jgi:hypothetical protein
MEPQPWRTQCPHLYAQAMRHPPENRLDRPWVQLVSSWVVAAGSRMVATGSSGPSTKVLGHTALWVCGQGMVRRCVCGGGGGAGRHGLGSPGVF